MLDAFTRTTVPHGGQRKRGFTISCGRCGRLQSEPINTFKGSAENEDIAARFIEKKFHNSGWKVGKNASQHRCPGCFAAIRNAAKEKQLLKQKEAEVMGDNVVKIVPGAPRSMEREDRRIVFEKLNDVYLDEKAGYSADWTDAKVSNDLGVPRDWVKQVREEMFGPEGSNGKIDAALAEAKEILAEIRKMASEKFANDLQALLHRAQKIEKTIIEIEKAVH